MVATRRPAASETGDPLLLTPGPLTTSKAIKEAMVHDWGSRDATFVGINKAVMDELPKVIHGGSDFVTVPMQGSGTFAVEGFWREAFLWQLCDPEAQPPAKPDST